MTDRIDKFTSPRQVRRKLELDASISTINRRLNEVGLFGRDARHQRDYSAAEITQWHFLQDNARYHDAPINREWFHNRGISVLDFPAYSPDLNPIQYLWAVIAREVEKIECNNERS